MILSIESSCDDSSIAITEIKTKKLIFYKKISQEQEHNKYGGVVPELASRLHLEALPKLLGEAKPYFNTLKAIAVTNEPGLSVTLMEGVMMAKALSISLNIPLIEVNHLVGHIYSLFIEKEVIFPLNSLLLSGGHTMLLEVNNYHDIKIVATTGDDSFGESFDKVSKMLDLGYPGGPIIEEYALSGDKDRFNFPIPLSKSPRMEFSYSGLKNAVRLSILEIDKNSIQDKYDIAASFQNAATKHILQKTDKYLKTKPSDDKNKYLAIVGGASANQFLRTEINNLANKYNLKLLLTDLKYTSDNAAMIGRVACDKFNSSDFVSIENLKVKSKTAF